MKELNGIETPQENNEALIVEKGENSSESVSMERFGHMKKLLELGVDFTDTLANVRMATMGKDDFFQSEKASEISTILDQAAVKFLTGIKNMGLGNMSELGPILQIDINKMLRGIREKNSKALWSSISNLNAYFEGVQTVLDYVQPGQNPNKKE